MKNTDTPRSARTRMETAHLLCDSDDFEDVISTLKKEGAELERELDEARAELAELWSRFDKQMEAESRLAEAEELIKRGHDGWQKAEVEVERLRAELVERDMEWFQVIESFAGFHPVSITDALNRGITRSKKATKKVARLREALEDIANMPKIDQDDAHRLRHKAQVALAPAPDWRELGPDEVIQEGDEEKHRDCKAWFQVAPSDIGRTPSDIPNYQFRTRRPLPPVVDQTQCKWFKASEAGEWRERAHKAEAELAVLWARFDKQMQAEAEVEWLRSQLNRAVEIAEKIWSDCSNGSEHTELAALKGELK